jgi:nuclear pore complex protein Nup54
VGDRTFEQTQGRCRDRICSRASPRFRGTGQEIGVPGTGACEAATQHTREHAAIAQRTLRLAIKCQILRNRGYALDSTEETLRRNILDLSKRIQEPSFSSREEEIWARMVALRERARWLEDEGKRVGAATAEAQKQEGNSLPANVLQGANRILRDYDGQLMHLAKELEEVKKEYQEWDNEKRR